MSYSLTSRQVLKQTGVALVIVSLFACGGELPNTQSDLASHTVQESSSYKNTIAYSDLGASNGEQLIPSSPQELADIKEAENTYNTLAAQEANVDGFIVHYKEDQTSNSSDSNLTLSSAKLNEVASNSKLLAQSSLLKYNQAGKSLGLALQVVNTPNADGTELQLNKTITLQQASEYSSQLMASDNRIQYVEPNLLFQSSALTPGQSVSDQKFLMQWGLNQYSPTFAATNKSFGVNPEQAWTKTTGETIGVNNTGAPVVVAVLDTGSTDHEDLVGQYLPGYDFVSNAKKSKDGNGWDNDPTDPGDSHSKNFCGTGVPNLASSWHGTKVASVIAALMNNSTSNSNSLGGMVGVAPNTKIVPVRVTGPCGAALSDIATAIRWAVGGSIKGVPVNGNPAKIINLSLATPSSICTPSLANAIAFANARGAVVVVPSGNSKKLSGTTVNFTSPANCVGAITVGSIKESGSRADYSNFGALVDVSAPGEGIVAASFNTLVSKPDTPISHDYVTTSGTSFAAAHVSGVLALMYAAQPTLAPNMATTLLKLHVSPIPKMTSPNLTAAGVGLVDATAVVSAISGTKPFVVNNDLLGLNKSQIVWKGSSGGYYTSILNFASSSSNYNGSNPDLLTLTEPELSGINLSNNNSNVFGIGKFNSEANQVLATTVLNNTNGLVLTENSAISAPYQLVNMQSGYIPLGKGNFYADSLDEYVFRYKTNNTIVIKKFGDALPSSSSNEVSALEKTFVVSKNLAFKGIADFNNDGYSDILWQKPNGVLAILYISENTGMWQDVVGLTAREDVIGVGDFAGDSSADIVFRNKINGQVFLLQFSQSGLVTKIKSTKTINAYDKKSIVKVGDFNGDSKNEILVFEYYEDLPWVIAWYSFDQNSQLNEGVYQLFDQENGTLPSTHTPI